MTERSRRQRAALTVAGWLATAALATAVTLAAVSSIGTGIFASSAGPLDRAEIEQALATAPPARSASPRPEPTTGTPTAPGTSTTQGTPEATAAPTGAPEVITSPGGNVLARCIGGRVELVSWSPAQGYHVDSVDRDLRREAEIEFEAEDRDVEIKVRCVDGVLQRTVENKD